MRSHLLTAVFLSFSTLAPAASGPYLYAYTDPPAIRNDGKSTFTYYVVTSGQNIAEVDCTLVTGGPLKMFDDGTHGDKVANDGIYTLNNLTMPVHALGFGGAFLRWSVGTFLKMSDGTVVSPDTTPLGLVNPAINYPALQLARSVWATSNAVFVVDPKWNNLMGFTASDFDASVNPFLLRATNAVYPLFPRDGFDFVAAFPGRQLLIASTYGEGAPFFVRVTNQVQNIGLDTLDLSNSYGSGSRLKGVIYHSYGEGAILTHEFGHNWMAFVGNALNLNGGVHWNPFTDIGGPMPPAIPDPAATNGFGFLFGYLVDNGDGTWKQYQDPQNLNGVYSKTDLYLMGLIPSSAVPPIHLLSNPNLSNTNKITADHVSTYSILQLDKTNGMERIPNSQNSQKNFSTAFVIIKDSPYAQAEFAFYSSVAAYYTTTSRPPVPQPSQNGSPADAFVTPFYTATGGLATMTADLPPSAAIVDAANHEVTSVSPGAKITFLGVGLVTRLPVILLPSPLEPLQPPPNEVVRVVMQYAGKTVYAKISQQSFTSITAVVPGNVPLGRAKLTVAVQTLDQTGHWISSVHIRLNVVSSRYLR